MSAIEPPSEWPTRIGASASSWGSSAGRTSSASSWKNRGVRGRGGGSERPCPKRENATTRRPVASFRASGKSRQSPSDPRPSWSSTSGRRSASPGHSATSRRRPATVTLAWAAMSTELAPPFESGALVEQMRESTHFEFHEVSGSRVHASMMLNEDHHQPFGIVHGGVYAFAVEGVASYGANAAIADRGMYAVGVNNSTDFVRPMVEGRVDGVGLPIFQGPT